MVKVLIVEDDQLMSRMYFRVFTYEKFEVQVAANGQAGLDKLKDFHPNIILVDVMMPVLNGVEMLARLKADPATRDIPVIMLTNLSDIRTAEDALKRGAVQYVVKSKHEPEDIVTIVKHTLSDER
jgi:CheY-like chemotaxis protein